jgi:hypothetical protein
LIITIFQNPEAEFMNWDEKRKYPRFKASDTALAASGGDPCTLMDLSTGGVGIQLYGDQPLPTEINLDLFFLNRELALSGIRCKKVFEARVDKGRAGQIHEWRVGLQFEDPGPEMLKILKHFRWTED